MQKKFNYHNTDSDSFYLYLCIVKLNYSCVMKYNEFLLDFSAYRRKFNRMFKLSLNHRFCGLLRLGAKLHQFVRKLERILLNRKRTSKPLGDVITFKVGDYRIDLYNV